MVWKLDSEIRMDASEMHTVILIYFISDISLVEKLFFLAFLF